ncbi:MAG: GlsB/YeaQ/YmgE family stress response membrane protein [Chloroflexota bacterium]
MSTVVIAATLNPGGIIAWLVVGAIAGALAGRVMSGGGYGLIGDIVVGIIGAFIGGFLVSLFTSKSYGVIGSIVVAFIGACVLLAILHAVSGNRARV